jgi:hypothetical protein
VTFCLKLHDDELTKKKLTVMRRLEAMFDDERNILPELFYRMFDCNSPECIKFGETVKISIEVVQE